MSTADQLQSGQEHSATVPTTIENAADWPEISQQIATDTGQPATVTPELVAELLGSGVALLFSADAARDMNRLRGTFADPVIAQCQRNTGCLNGERPVSTTAKLIGAPTVNGHPAVRTHLSISVEQPNGEASTSLQVWDLEIGAEVTVGQATCPNCGAPLAPGELVCGHCGTDVRSVMAVPLVVSRLELY